MAHHPHQDDNATLQEQFEFELRQAGHTQTDTNKSEQNGSIDAQNPKSVANNGTSSLRKDGSNDFEEIDREDVDAFHEEIEFELRRGG